MPASWSSLPLRDGLHCAHEIDLLSFSFAPDPTPGPKENFVLESIVRSKDPRLRIAAPTMKFLADPSYAKGSERNGIGSGTKLFVGPAQRLQPT